MTTFGERAQLAASRTGRLCVGIDPHPGVLDAWGEDNTAEGAKSFALRLIDEVAGTVGFIKPQVAFFEQFGAAGFAALEKVLSYGREQGLLVIADAKRGDIGSTMDLYAEAWLSKGAPMEVDALTVSSYLGVGALSGAFDIAERNGKGLFVLAATSNPEAAIIQSALTSSDRSVAQEVLSAIDAHNAANAQTGSWGSVGAVIGATKGEGQFGMTPLKHPAPLLVPGFGAQGAKLGDVNLLFPAQSDTVIANEGRSLLMRGREGLASALHVSISELEGTRSA